MIRCDKIFIKICVNFLKKTKFFGNFGLTRAKILILK